MDGNLIDSLNNLPRGTTPGDFLDAIVVGMNTLIKKFGFGRKGNKHLYIIIGAQSLIKELDEGTKEKQKIAQERIPTLKKYSDKEPPNDPYATWEVKRGVEDKSREDPNKTMLPEQRIKGFHCGPQVIPISTIEQEALKLMHEKEPGDTKAILAIFALVRVMEDTKSVAIVHYTISRKSNANVPLVDEPLKRMIEPDPGLLCENEFAINRFCNQSQLKVNPKKDKASRRFWRDKTSFLSMDSHLEDVESVASLLVQRKMFFSKSDGSAGAKVANTNGKQQTYVGNSEESIRIETTGRVRAKNGETLVKGDGIHETYQIGRRGEGSVGNSHQGKLQTIASDVDEMVSIVMKGGHNEKLYDSNTVHVVAIGSGSGRLG
eukprot:Gb_03010 [translate_table: standard]